MVFLSIVKTVPIQSLWQFFKAELWDAAIPEKKNYFNGIESFGSHAKIRMANFRMS
jgi:hypothetical protein